MSILYPLFLLFYEYMLHNLLRYTETYIFIWIPLTLAVGLSVAAFGKLFPPKYERIYTIIINAITAFIYIPEITYCSYTGYILPLSKILYGYQYISISSIPFYFYFLFIVPTLFCIILSILVYKKTTIIEKKFSERIIPFAIFLGIAIIVNFIGIRQMRNYNSEELSPTGLYQYEGHLDNKTEKLGLPMSLILNFKQSVIPPAISLSSPMPMHDTGNPLIAESGAVFDENGNNITYQPITN